MSVKVDKKENNKVKLTIEVDKKKFEEGMQKAYIKNRKKFNIPGFRKGKAPKKLIETYYGEAVFYEDAINIVCPEEYENALKETKIDPVSRPEIDIEQIGKDQNLIFTAQVEVKPDFEVSEYKGIEVEKNEYNVTEEQVESRLNQMQFNNSRLIAVEDRPVQKGDIVQIDFEGFIDGEPFEGGKAENQDLEIGSGQFIPGFEEQLIGKNAGEDAEVKVTFPEDYGAKDLASKEAVFNVKIKEIKYRELPEIDDEFAKDVSEFDTLDELKEDIKNKLKEEAERKAKVETENAVLDKIAEKTEIDIPDAMIKGQVENLKRDFEMRLSMQGMNIDQYLEMAGINKDNYESQFVSQAEKQVKNNLILEKISKLENVKVNDDDIEEYFEKLSKNYNMEVDKIKDMFKGENELSRVKDELAIEKTIDLLVENAKFIEKTDKDDDTEKKTDNKKDDEE